MVLRTTNLARFSALQGGRDQEVDHAVGSLDDIACMAEEIATFAPDIIFSAASLQSWWVISLLPSAAFRRVSEAGFGPWLPMHLAPVLKLMRAVRASGSQATVVNAAFPDAVHPVLRTIGLSPHVGIGNVANNVPALRVIAAKRLGCPVAEIRARFVAHHYVSNRISRVGDPGFAPISLTFWRAGEDVTDDVEIDTIFKPLLSEYRRLGGRDGQVMTAASALSVLEPLADGQGRFIHAPGPGGLIGGYPLRLENGEFRLDLPPGLSQDDAIEINIAGQREDGISAITDDGTVFFEERAENILYRELGYRCPRMHWSEVDECAAELATRYQAYRESVRD
jgi:hypothetical protein